jgi:FolB domain-containing protein
MDILSLHNLEVWTHVGVPDEERTKEQRLLVTVKMELDACAAGKNDNVQLSINYDDVAKAIHAIAVAERKTIEKFAEDIATMILSDFKPHAVIVTIHKFILSDAASVSITIHRP